MTSHLRVLLWYWGRRGGGPRYTFELARALRDRGDVDVFLSLSRQSEIFDTFEELELPGWHVNTYTKASEAALATLRLPSVRRSFWRYVEEQRIDVVVGTMSHIWNVPTLLGRRSKVPYLCVLHDALPHRGDDLPLRQWLLKQEVSRAQGVVTLTDHVRRILKDHHGYASPNTWVIPHGVFPYAQSSGVRRDETAPLKLLFFGRLHPYKGLDLLLTAYAALREAGRNVELTIAGPGDVTPYQKQLAELDGIKLNVRWILEEEIGPIFTEADLCVLPYREASQSGVIATAYAAGIPVVATPIGGLVEQVTPEETGLVSDAATPEALVQSITRFLNDPVLLQHCSEGALRAAETTLAWPAIADQFRNACQQVQGQATGNA